MNFNEIATVSGKGGLFSIVSPTRGGMILETMDDKKKKMVVNMNAKVSVLGEISIYTTDSEGSKPLEDVMKAIHAEYEGDTGLTGSSDPEELKSFLKSVLPTYDEDQVYVSDIKKLVNWYNLLSAGYPEVFEEQKEEEAEAETSEEK
ncbi:DUF5606 family protein [Reichenbachiella versicolor]|uniref:DUF5606 family protein n=1 Tax=Reichenbachiella versicolor TaxID=1821036 RepID=UPI000D6E9896|nr:DUF5606 domain-containing protein [Reichenbachiella versicolor]